MLENQIFKPAKSKGGKYLIFITIAITILFIIILITTYPFLQRFSLSIVILGIFIAIIVIFILLLYAYYELEYILSDKYLLIKWGLKTTRIPIGNVKRIIKPETKNYNGIRLGGVGIPGYLLGKFKFLIEGEFETVFLYATKLDNLLYIETKGQKRKLYGITPAKDDDFIKNLNDMSRNIESQVIKKPKTLEITSSRDIKYALSLFLISIVLSISGLIYFLIIYFQLPQTIPLHFSIYFVPDRYGNKIDLLWIFLFFVIFGIGLSSILYYYIHRKTHLDQTKYGYSIMLLPIAISLLYLILTIFLMNLTLAFG
ncbi:MAG: PH domain-containing protein [Candidatus Odinarchaeota archaeon]